MPEWGTIDWNVDETAGATICGGPPELQGVAFPLSPFSGCFGVAPAGGQAITSVTSGDHGGNMDYRGFVAGVTAYFPVFVPGALFFLGDGHAVQGDGEISGSAIEVSFEVEFQLDLIKGKTIRRPKGESESHIFAIGNARPLDQATQHATSEMMRWLTEDYALDTTSASFVMSLCVEYDIANMVDPAYTVVCKMPKHVLRNFQ